MSVSQICGFCGEHHSPVPPMQGVNLFFVGTDFQACAMISSATARKFFAASASSLTAVLRRRRKASVLTFRSD